MSGSLLDYYKERRNEKRRTETNERRLGYAVAGVAISDQRAENFRREGDMAMRAKDYEYAEQCYASYRAARKAAALGTFETLDRLSALGR